MYLSASSNIKNSILDKSRAIVVSKLSHKRPGVATRMFKPRLIRSFSDFFFMPPIKEPGTIQIQAFYKLNEKLIF